jgi:DNA-binding MarR family transcriptional regulator
MDDVEQIEDALSTIFNAWLASSRSLSTRIGPDVGYHGMVLLIWLTHRDGSRLTDIADHFGVGKGTMSRQLSALEERGHVVREPCPNDARSVLFSVSQATTAAIAEAHKQDSAWRRAALSQWDPEDLAEFGRVLTKFADLERQRASAV